MFPETLETPSLTLRQFSPAHVDVFELYELFEDVPQEPYGSVKEAHDQLSKAEETWNDGEAAQFAVYSSEDELAGYTGLFLEWGRRSGRIGFILGRPYWGRGYAGECARAMTDLAFDRLDLELVAIGYEEGNDRSKRARRTSTASAGSTDGCLRNWTPLGDTVASHHHTVIRAEYRETTST